MAITDYFRPVKTASVAEVRSLMEGKAAGEYNLVDVRQPREYEMGHLPGARLIPMAEIRSRLHELDPGKPTVTY